ncbi:hypothetical protein, partial [Catenovulum agarivorans]|uniref:hypothetical protein n=1 Tax=Catenovulum agarivorans TaxID=1172192 RepID=UPI001ED942AF
HLALPCHKTSSAFKTHRNACAQKVYGCVICKTSIGMEAVCERAMDGLAAFLQIIPHAALTSLPPN